MTYADSRGYETGSAFGESRAKLYGPHEALACLRRGEYDAAFTAGACDALLDYVQTREELAPGCYRVRVLRGAE